MSVLTEALVYIDGMRGLGDNIFQRAYVKELDSQVHLQTPWPELYRDLPNVKVLKSETSLRTQNKNVRGQEESVWTQKLVNYDKKLKLTYGNKASLGSIQGMFQGELGVRPKHFDLPNFNCVLNLPEQRKIAVVRPVTLRKEWFNCARNPDPIYIAEAIAILRQKGFFIISIADLKENEEWLVGEDLDVDLKFHSGELDVINLLGLIKKADVLIGGVGWILPAAISYDKELLLIAGGQGAHNSEEKIADPKRVQKNKVCWVLPDDYCMCTNPRHQCSKKITNFTERVTDWIQTLN